MVTSVAGSEIWNAVSAPYHTGRKALRTANVFATESYAVFTCMLLNMIRWHFHTLVLRDITAYRLTAGSGDATLAAILYLHKGIPKDSKGRATLLTHGDHSHPYSTLHLADIAKRISPGPVFSLWMPTTESYSREMHSLAQQTLKMMKQVVQEQNAPWRGVVVTGHSIGPIQWAYEAFVQKASDIKAIIAIASRLRITNDPTRPCRAAYIGTINKIYSAIRWSVFSIPLYQIGAGDDWCTPIDEQVVRRKKGFYTIDENAMHLNVICRRKCNDAFEKYLRRSLSLPPVAVAA